MAESKPFEGLVVKRTCIVCGASFAQIRKHRDHDKHPARYCPGCHFKRSRFNVQGGFKNPTKPGEKR